MAEKTLRVQGLRELTRAFALADKELNRRLRASLRDVAEPVRSDAESRAAAQIPRVGIPWSQMRVGVTRTGVYVAPRARGARGGRGRRPNLATLLLGRAMEPALDANQGQVVDAFEEVLDDVADLWGRGG